MSENNDDKKWTYEERSKFVDLLIANKSIKEIAVELGRTGRSTATAFSRFGGASEHHAFRKIDRSKGKKRDCNICKMPIYCAHKSFYFFVNHADKQTITEALEILKSMNYMARTLKN